MEAGCPLRPCHAAPSVPARSASVRGSACARAPSTAGSAGGRPARRSVHRLGRARLGVSVLAVPQKGGCEPFRGQDRRCRTAGRDAALHRAVHGAVPSRQLARRVVGQQVSGHPASVWELTAAACSPPPTRIDSRIGRTTWPHSKCWTLAAVPDTFSSPRS